MLCKSSVCARPRHRKAREAGQQDFIVCFLELSTLCGVCVCTYDSHSPAGTENGGGEWSWP